MGPTTARPIRVLVCDDNRDAADTLGEVVRLLGYDVRVSYDGPAALVAAEEFRPDACLLDLLMPGVDGYELAGWLREQQGDRAMLLAAVTACADEDARRKARAAGFDLHLVKPVAPAEIAAALARAPGRGVTRRTPDPDHPADDAAAAVARLVSPESRGGSWVVVLRAPGESSVELGPYPNPAVAKDRAEAVRRFVAAVLRGR